MTRSKKATRLIYCIMFNRKTGLYHALQNLVLIQNMLKHISWEHVTSKQTFAAPTIIKLFLSAWNEIYGNSSTLKSSQTIRPEPEFDANSQRMTFCTWHNEFCNFSRIHIDGEIELLLAAYGNFGRRRLTKKEHDRKCQARRHVGTYCSAVATEISPLDVRKSIEIFSPGTLYHNKETFSQLGSWQRKVTRNCNNGPHNIYSWRFDLLVILKHH